MKSAVQNDLNKTKKLWEELVQMLVYMEGLAQITN